MAKSTAQTFREPISFLPEDMVSGLADDIDCHISRVRIVPIYVENRNAYRGYVVIDFTPDESSGQNPFNQRYSACDLASFVPSMDGKTPAGGTTDDYLQLAAGEGTIPDDEIAQYEGVQFLPIANSKSISNSSNFALFLNSLVAADVKVRDIWSTDVRFMEGMYVHVNRLEPDEKTKKGRSGLQEGAGDGKKGDGKVLLVTQIHELPNAKKKASSVASKPGASKPAASKSTPAKAAQIELEEEEPEEQDQQEEVETGTADAGDNEERDFDSEVSAAVLEILATKNGKVARSALLPLIMGHFEGKDKPAAMQRAGQDDFLTGYPELWKYDSKTKALTLA